jgi:SSS family solute:Na+ symporter
LIPIFGLMLVGDGSILDGITTLTTENPDKFNAVGTKTDSIPFATIFTGMMLVQLFYWGTNQQIIQRGLAAKNLKEGQKGLILASFIKILGPLIVVLPGIIAYHVFEGNLENADSAYPMLVNKVLPSGLLGFFAAVLFGAILSSFNSVLNSSVTLFGIDIYKQHINKDADEKTVVKYGKRFGVVLAIASMFIAPMLENAGSLFDYLQEVNGIYSIPILTIIVVGYLTKFVPALAAKIGLLSGSILYILSQFILQPYFVGSALDNAAQNGITDANQLAVIEADAYPHFLHVMAILFVTNIIIMLIIGKLSPRKTPFELEYTKQVDITPWKHVKLAGALVVIIVISTYVYFQ